MTLRLLIGMLLFSSTLRAQEPPALFGTVTITSSGEAAEGVTVTIRWDPGIPDGNGVLHLGAPIQATTDRTGHFSFGSLKETGPYVLTIDRNGSPGFVDGQRTTWAGVRSDTIPLALSATFPRPATISGTVRDSSGKPAPGILVMVFASPGLTKIATTGITDARGEYRLNEVPPGEFRILARLQWEVIPIPGQSTRQDVATYYRQAIRVSEGEEARGIDITMGSSDR